MKYEFAVITTDGDTPDSRAALPIALSKIREVADGRSSFTNYEDQILAEWALKINEILMLR